MPPLVTPPPPADPASDPSSPYYVHSNDGPFSVKVTPVLTGSNYHSWARSMRHALGAKLKFEFLDDSIPVSVDAFDPSYRAWNHCNMLIHSDLVRVSELQQEIYALTQDSRSVTSFYSYLKTLWEELEIYLPIPTCTCPVRCACEAMRLARNHHHLLQAMRFLTGLNDSFNVVKSHILLLDPLPFMTKIFSMVLQFERQNFPINLDDSKALVNASDGKPHGS
ncbi:retrovirus-related pol polyprotein from transposon TNT 1-94, partial [Trifolium medium]|nr:retrovirus-related pol polyprotein from transposon TNT 1-94 [Trifolium medium]